MTNSIKFKRFLAYFIDILIISILSMLISRIKVLNPMQSKYQAAVKEFSKYNAELQESLENLTKIDAKALVTDEYITYMYNIDYYGVSYSIIEIVVCLCYFTLLPLANNGQTFGKEFMKIQVVNQDGSMLNYGKLLIRAFTIPVFASIFLYTAFSNSLLSILVFILKPHSYFYTSMSITLVFCILCYADIVYLLANKEDLSLHDKILKTKVVDYVRTK